jgi:tetratricopeptide (TPR) repeat protein
MLRARFYELIQTADELCKEEQYLEAIDRYNFAVALAEEKSFGLDELESAEINFKIGETAIAAFGAAEASDVYDHIMISFMDDPMHLARAHYELGQAFMDEGDWHLAEENLDLALRYLWREKDGGPAPAAATDAKIALSSFIHAKRAAIRYHLED